MERTLYRRRMNTYTWHFCRTCPDWPKDDYQETPDPCQWGDLCSGCQALLLRGNCLRSYGNGKDQGSDK